MTTLYFLDAAEFTDVSAVAAAQPGARVERLPGYVTITSDGPLVIDRRAAGSVTQSGTARKSSISRVLRRVSSSRDISARDVAIPLNPGWSNPRRLLASSFPEM